MGKLYDARLQIEKMIERQKLDPFKIKGMISLQAGFILSTVDADTPDDPKKLEKLKAIVKKILGETLHVS